MVDFAALPPEVNSARIYAGAGAGPLVAAASAWDGVAAELSSAARSYESVVSELTGGPWLGPTSASVAAAAAPYVGWISTTAVQAEQTANQARAAVAAYEAAFAATVPPPLIAANRALFAFLTITNVFGQNAPAIAANEAQYAEYWAQDAAAMYNYAGTSAGATTFTSFTEPQQTTNPAGVSAQGTAVSQAGSTTASNVSDILSQILNAVPNALQQLSSGPVAWAGQIEAQLEAAASSQVGLDTNYFVYNVGADLSALSGPWFLAAVFPELVSPLFSLALPSTTAAAGVSSVAPAGAAGSTLLGSVGPQADALGSSGLGAVPVSAGAGEATTVGKLSVPQTWAAAAPEIRLASTALPTAALGALPEVAAGGAGSWFSGIPVMGNVVNASRGSEPDSRSGSDGKVRQPAGKFGAEQDRPGWWRQPERRSPAVQDDALTERERDELSELRKEITELAMERDAAARLIKEAIRK